MKKHYRISGVDCANCAAKMEQQISKIEGVKSCSVNFLLQKLTIETEAELLEGIIKKAAEIMKKIDREARIVC